MQQNRRDKELLSHSPDSALRYPPYICPPAPISSRHTWNNYFPSIPIILVLAQGLIPACSSSSLPKLSLCSPRSLGFLVVSRAALSCAAPSHALLLCGSENKGAWKPEGWIFPVGFQFSPAALNLGRAAPAALHTEGCGSIRSGLLSMEGCDLY